MNIPAKLIICGKEWTIKKDAKHAGGKFDTGTKEIVIGTKDAAQDITETFVHEILEVILTYRDLRYQLNYEQPENEDYLFNFNHKQFTQVCAELSGVLNQIKGK